jgi:hypothetical protein
MHGERWIRLAGTAALSVLLAACAARPELPRPPLTLASTACPPGNCTITVRVTGNCAVPGNVQVDKPLVEAREPVVMVFDLDSSSHEFSPGGIFFVPPSEQFEIMPGATSKQIKVRNKKTDRQTTEHYYLVLLKGCWPLDPWVRNTH